MVEVSILCLSYNHVNFIKKALDSFVEQKTTFEFEIIIHDDASTDGTDKIIKEYEIKYPNIIKPIYENYNMFSRGINIVNDIMLPKAKGKYIALCECDDYWCDMFKLQKQYDFMEKNIDCSLCVHNTCIHDLSNKYPDKNFFDWKEIHVLNKSEIFMGWNVHTSSYFLRRDCLKYTDDLPAVWCGDFARLLYAFSKGTVIAIPEVMSVYNINNANGLTYKNCVDNEKLVKKMQARKEFLLAYDKYTDGKNSEIILKRRRQIEFDIEMLKLKKVLEEDHYKYRIYKRQSKKLLKNTEVKEYINHLSLPKRIINLLSIRSYILFNIRQWIVDRRNYRV